MKKTYEDLGIPQAEREHLAGVVGVWRQEPVYEGLKKEYADLGIIFCSMDTAVQEYPELVEFPDNIRQLEALERVGLVPAQRCERMKAAYLDLRQRVHELALDEGGRVVPAADFAPVRDFVREVWAEVFSGAEGE